LTNNNCKHSNVIATLGAEKQRRGPSHWESSDEGSTSKSDEETCLKSGSKLVKINRNLEIRLGDAKDTFFFVSLKDLKLQKIFISPEEIRRITPNCLVKARVRTKNQKGHESGASQLPTSFIAG
jgi:hypothetical protein